MTKIILPEPSIVGISSKLNVFQIYYNDATRQAILPNFIPLDNSANLRPDWAEYWSIREFFINNEIDENDWYGFLSPRFAEKTGLTDSQAMAFLNQHKDEDYDVMIFSPFWGQTTYYLNPFEQGDMHHANLSAITQRFLELIGSRVSVSNLVTHSQNTAWCNYIVAKPKFWLRWMSVTNALFQMAENKESELYGHLNGLTEHRGASTLPYKIFILERLATVLFATEPWRVKTFDPFNLPSHTPSLNVFRNELVACDALKQKYAETGEKMYFDAYIHQRNLITEKFSRR